MDDKDKSRDQLLGDLTELRRQVKDLQRGEEALRKSEEKYRMLSEITWDWIYWLDNDNRFVYCSPSCERITGYSADEFVNNPSLLLSIVHPDDRILMDEHLKTYHLSPNHGQADFRIIRRDGEVRWIEHFCKAVVTEDDCCLERRSGNRDVTERKRVEAALDLRNKIAEIFITVPDDEMFNGVLNIILDVMHSPFGVFGYIDEAGSLVVPTMTRQIWDKCRVLEKTFIFPRDTWGNSSWPRAIREKKPNYSNEVSNKTPQGHVTLTRHISLPILFQGEVVGLFQVANKETDYSEADLRTLEEISGYVAAILVARIKRQRAEESLKKAVADLKRSNEELQQFAYVASHDLQEPLRAVASFTQLLSERYKGRLDTKADEFIAFAVDGANRMQTLINDLLTYSRLETRGKPPEPTDSHDALGRALANLGTAIRESGALVTNDDLPTLKADESQLVQLFQNLIGNAIKFHGQEPPRVHVSAIPRGGEWLFTVRDNGIGIAQEYRERIFSIFQRLHSREEYPGTGIGLALCKRIVERHGGKIWVESGPERGSTFLFTLPNP